MSVPEAHPEIKAGSLVLRPTSDDDLALLRDFFADPGVNKFWGRVALEDSEIIAKYTGRRSPTVECFIVQQADEPVGFIQYCAESLAGGSIDLVLRPNHRGRGVGTAAVNAMVNYLRQEERWRRITVDPDATNVRGVDFWTAVGFVPQERIDNDPDRDPYWLMVWPI